MKWTNTINTKSKYLVNAIANENTRKPAVKTIDEIKAPEETLMKISKGFSSTRKGKHEFLSLRQESSIS